MDNTNSTVAHNFAHNRNDKAMTNAKGTIYWESYDAFRAIYSYGSHFPVAIIMNDGRQFRNFDNWGITTSQHQSTIFSAMSGEITTLSTATIKILLDSLQIEEMRAGGTTGIFNKAQSKTRINTTVKKLKKDLKASLQSFIKLSLRKRAENTFNEAVQPYNNKVTDINFLIEHFKLKLVKADKFPNTFGDENASENLRKSIANAKKNEAARVAKFNKAVIKAKPYVWRAVEDWRGGAVAILMSVIPEFSNKVKQAALDVMLADIGGNVFCRTTYRDNKFMFETTNGIRIHIDKCLGFFELMKRAKAKGKRFDLTGKKIAGFAMDYIDENGTLHASCHHITLSEGMKAFAQYEAKNHHNRPNLKGND